MPMIRARYPENWETMAFFLKSLNDWHCAECGRPCRRPGESIDDLEERVGEWPDAYDHVVDDESGEWGYVFKKGRFTLTVAHLDHDPSNSDPANLLPLCASCHCKLDIRKEAIARKQALKLEWQGQLNLLNLIE